MAWGDARDIGRPPHLRPTVREAPCSCQPAVASRSPDDCGPWGLTHVLRDGHPGVHATAEAGRPLRLLSLLSLDGSLPTPEQAGLVQLLRQQSAVGRRPR